MCLILLALNSHPGYSLIVAANRDEFYDRPSAPAAFWSEAPGLLAGRDLRAGGTWLGVDRRGRLAAVTNYRQGHREGAARRSRGHLVSEFLTTPVTAREHVERAAREADQYNGFNLLAGDVRELRYFSNRDGVPRPLPPGVYGLSNHLLDTPWPKVTSGRNALQALVGAEAPELITGLFALLSDRNQPSDDLLPRTGVGRQWERLLSSAFIASGDYGTRSSTVVLLGRDGSAVFVERTFAAGGTPAGEVRYEFELTAAPAARNTAQP